MCKYLLSIATCCCARNSQFEIRRERLFANQSWLSCAITDSHNYKLWRHLVDAIAITSHVLIVYSSRFRLSMDVHWESKLITLTRIGPMGQSQSDELESWQSRSSPCQVLRSCQEIREAYEKRLWRRTPNQKLENETGTWAIHKYFCSHLLWGKRKTPVIDSGNFKSRVVFWAHFYVSFGFSVQ